MARIARTARTELPAVLTKPGRGRRDRAARKGQTPEGAAPTDSAPTDTRTKGSRTKGATAKGAATKGTSAKGAPKPGAATEPSAPTPRKGLPLPIRLFAMLLAFAAMVVFAVVLAKLTLQPSPASAALVHSNLHPGRSLRLYLDQPETRDAIRQIGGNLLLGLPFGVLLPVLAPRIRGIVRVGLVTAVVMLLVELVQGALITGRAFDIDDVILNTSGALVGYLILGRRLGRVVHRRERRARRRDRRAAE
ncbi:VanZ family protein [Actinobacteria bacterium OK074]|nr:VanZ family protein [Actinobacteria bacterium OK074]